MDEYEEDRLTAVRMAQKLLESGGKEGVYYILRFPTRWRLYSFPWEDFGDVWHADAWRHFIINDLAEAWKPSVDIDAEKLKPWWKGFPRGRVERFGVGNYTVFHGNDLASTGVSSHRVETAFELGNSAVKWLFDPHEQQNPEHRAALSRLLPDA